MDVVLSIWLSSVTSALLFFSGGRLWGKALLQRAIEPLIRAARAARLRSEAEIEELSETVRRQRVEAIGLRASLEQLQIELGIERLRAEDAARLEVENGVLRQQIEGRWRAAGPEDVALAERAAAPGQRRPIPEQKLEEALEDRLDELRHYEGSCRTVVLSDMRGLLVASSGDVAHHDELAAAASMAGDTTSRLRELLSLGEPREIRLVDVHDAVVTVRWLRGDHDGLLLSTLGVATAKADPRAEAIGAAISNLIRGT
jgi:hypothetical protein